MQTIAQRVNIVTQFLFHILVSQNIRNSKAIVEFSTNILFCKTNHSYLGHIMQSVIKNNTIFVNQLIGRTITRIPDLDEYIFFMKTF